MVLIFLNHRREVVRRRTEFRLRKAEDRRHIVEGLLRALDAIDRVIAIIRGSSDAATARSNLVSELDFTEIQAQAILDMRLQRLTGLEREKLDDELAQLLMDIERYHSILSSHVVPSCRRSRPPTATSAAPTSKTTSKRLRRRTSSPKKRSS